MLLLFLYDGHKNSWKTIQKKTIEKYYLKEQNEQRNMQHVIYFIVHLCCNFLSLFNSLFPFFPLLSCQYSFLFFSKFSFFSTFFLHRLTSFFSSLSLSVSLSRSLSLSCARKWLPLNFLSFPSTFLLRSFNPAYLCSKVIIHSNSYPYKHKRRPACRTRGSSF